MEMQSDESNTFINLKTGDIVAVDNTALRKAEDDEPYDHLPDWQQEEMKTAIDILENEENYVPLPSQFDIHEYSMMENFCYSLPDEDIGNELLSSIRGKGAFRRFKEKIYYLGLEDKWYQFRDKCYKDIAIEWCENHDIEYF